MSVANLTRYEVVTCFESNLCKPMFVQNDGEWVKFDEAVEASSNSLQQLKADIRSVTAILKASVVTNNIGIDVHFCIKRLSELSAV